MYPDDINQPPEGPFSHVGCGYIGMLCTLWAILGLPIYVILCISGYSKEISVIFSAIFPISIIAFIYLFLLILRIWSKK